MSKKRTFYPTSLPIFYIPHQNHQQNTARTKEILLALGFGISRKARRGCGNLPMLQVALPHGWRIETTSVCCVQHDEIYNSAGEMMLRIVFDHTLGGMVLKEGPCLPQNLVA